MECCSRPPLLRIAVSLSGGVDSAVAALLLRRCVYTGTDVAALRRFGFPDAPPPPLQALQAAVAAATPLTHLLPDSIQRQLCELAPPAHGVHNVSEVEFFPFFMRNWHDHDGSRGWCVQSQRDYDDATAVARELHLLSSTTSLPVLDFAEAYAERCFRRMLNAYAAGHTLNVDVLCNSHIKFGAAAQALHVTQAALLLGRTPAHEPAQRVQQQTLLATGHYARTWTLLRAVVPTEPPPTLLLQPCSAGCDLNDQTHFLSRVPPSALVGALFPIGHLFTSKTDVRALAQHAFSSSCSVAHIARKQTSTGLCFVGPPSRFSSSIESPSATNTIRKATNRSGVTQSPPPVSCKACFANFLNGFLPPPSPPEPPTPLQAHRTIFRDVTTNAEKWLIGGKQAFGALQADYPNFLPAYAVTLGQRLRLSDVPTNEKEKGKINGEAEEKEGGRVQNYYVVRKVCHPARHSQGDVRLLTEVHVVNRWDHPRLYTAQVAVASMRWWLPPAAVRRASLPLLLPGETSHHAVRCLCSLRHQMAPQPAVLRWTAEEEEEAEVKRGGGGGKTLRLRTCAVCFEAPVRAPAAGQAVVLYAALQEVAALLWLPDGTATATSPPTANAGLAVIGSGWVAVTEEEEA